MTLQFVFIGNTDWPGFFDALKHTFQNILVSDLKYVRLGDSILVQIYNKLQLDKFEKMEAVNAIVNI